MNYIAEIVKTFSSKSSFFSSKRLERFAIIAVALSANIVYLYFEIIFAFNTILNNK